MNFLLENYFTENEVKFYLPLIKGEVKKNGKSSYKGAQSDLNKQDFINIHNRKPVITKNGFKFSLATTYDKADLYELNFNSINDNICVIDIDGYNSLSEFYFNNKPLENLSNEEKEKWINENVPQFIKELPYTLSRSKNLPHYFCIVDGIEKEIFKQGNRENCLTFCKGDILTYNVWEKPNTEMLNFNGKIPRIKFEDLKKYIKTSKLESFEEKEINDDTFSKITLEDETDDEQDKQDETPKKEIKSTSDDNINRLHKILECYSRDWFLDRDNWFKFTIAFKNTFEGKFYNVYDKICQDFDKINNKFVKYDAEDNLKTWMSIKPKTKAEKSLSFASFIYWAKEQDEKKYNELFPKRKSNIDIDWNRLTEAEFAKNLYNKFFRNEKGEEMLIFTGVDKIPDGFYYNGVYWSNLGKNYCSIKRGYFNKLYQFYLNELNNLKTNGELEDSQYKKLLTKIQELDKILFRNNVVKIIVDEHWKKDKEIKWNSNNNLFPFENKIYDLSLGRFIDPSPEQYINITCGYDYIDREDNYIDEKREVHNFIDSILLKENLKDEKPFLLKVIASFLRQQNIDEIAYFLTGRGRNGKGTLSELIANTLGNFWGELNIEYYTAYAKSNNSHNQALYNCRNARVINTSEIADTNENGGAVKFISSNFKTITGGDTISARKCGSEEMVYFKAGKILIQTNVLPEFSKLDTSLKNRINIINFPYTFTDDENLLKQDPETYKMKDRTLKDKFNTTVYKNAFIQILFEYYKEYQKHYDNKKNPFKPPKSIVDNCNQYFDSSNGVKQWFLSRYTLQKGELKPKDKKKYLLKELVCKYLEEEGIKKNMTVKEFKLKLEEIDGLSKYIKINNNGIPELQQWVELHNDDEDDEDDDVDVNPLDF